LPKLHDWKDVADRFKDTLVLGNGASMAVYSNFGYNSLREVAIEEGFVTPAVQEVFDYLGTEDFELVLNMLWHAEHVNSALGVEELVTKQAYDEVREALVRAVRYVHCDYEIAEPHLPAIYGFMGAFRTVLSLSYDLIAYWAMLAGNEELGRYRFKDCFTDGLHLDANWERLREPIGTSKTTLVFYPHGNLVLTSSPVDGDRKVIRTNNPGESSTLLQRVLRAWEGGEGFPLFVSEGDWRQKLRAIQRSGYLSTVHSSVMSDLGNTVAVYGWAVKGNDRHILERLLRKGKEAFAVSVHTPTAGNPEQHCREIVTSIEGAAYRMRASKPEVLFFDADSAGSWINV
jgi:hypothetical protein